MPKKLLALFAIALLHVPVLDAWGVRGALYWKPTDNFSVDLSASLQRSHVNGFASAFTASTCRTPEIKTPQAAAWPGVGKAYATASVAIIDRMAASSRK